MVQEADSSSWSPPIDQLNEKELDQALAKILAEMQPAPTGNGADPATRNLTSPNSKSW